MLASSLESMAEKGKPSRGENLSSRARDIIGKIKNRDKSHQQLVDVSSNKGGQGKNRSRGVPGDGGRVREIQRNFCPEHLEHPPFVSRRAFNDPVGQHLLKI